LFDEKQARRFPCFHSSVNQIKTVLWTHSKTPQTLEQKGPEKREENSAAKRKSQIYIHIYPNQKKSLMDDGNRRSQQETV
jgi:hypothetical protein